jgi:molybdopterin-guanine dinucleotide biosynthesis protein A
MSPTAPSGIPVAAAVIAGGRSSRMGRNKAFLVHDGRRLLDRQLATLREVRPMELLVSGQRGTDYDVPGVRIVLDTGPDQGPLGGIAALLAASKIPHLLVLAVDMPHMTTEFLAMLVRQIGPFRGVVPRAASGWEPLAAIYPRAILPRVQAHLACGELSICRLVEAGIAAGELAPHEIGASQVRLFANWNRPEDVESLSLP